MDSARRHIVAACQSTYGSRFMYLSTSSSTSLWCFTWLITRLGDLIPLLRSNDYMAALAKVHCSCRGWSKSWKLFQFRSLFTHVCVYAKGEEEKDGVQVRWSNTVWFMLGWSDPNLFVLCLPCRVISLGQTLTPNMACRPIENIVYAAKNIFLFLTNFNNVEFLQIIAFIFFFEKYIIFYFTLP